MDTPAYDAKIERSDLKMFIGAVTSVDQERQMMTVSVMNKGEVGNVAINNHVSINGVGYRYCPIPYVSQVILYDQSGVLYHLGYVYNPKTKDGAIIGMSNSTNSNTGDKNLLGNMLLQRNLSFGESSLSGIGGSEVYMANDGSVYILNSSMSKIVLDSSLNAVLVSTPTQYTENNGIIVRSGAVLRKTSGVANTLEPYYSAGGSITSLSNLSEDTDVSLCTELQEFSIDVGVEASDTTGSYDKNSAPKSARFSVADIVIDEAGDPIVQNGSFLKVLLEATEGCGRFCIDETGVISFVDTTSGKDIENYISFSPGDNTSLDVLIDKVSVKVCRNEINASNDKSQIIMTSTGSVTVSNASNTLINVNDVGDVIIKTCVTDDKPKCTLIVSSDGTVSIEGADAGKLYKSILGEKFLQWVTDSLVSHVHGTAMGPSDTSAQLAGFVADDFTSKTLSNN